MKFLVIFALLYAFSSCQEAKNEAASQDTASQSQIKGMPSELEDPEDCDEKAKKAEEVVEVNLGGENDAGCSIE